MRATGRTQSARLAAVEREDAQEGWLLTAEDREVLGTFLNRLHDYQQAEDRRAAARARELGAWVRQQAAVESAERYPEPGSPHAELSIALRRATAREAAALESAQQAAFLAGEVADSEQRVADTLEGLSSEGDPALHERRAALAREALRGADLALQRGERLRLLVGRARDHLARATLRSLLGHAAAGFGDLARAERAIASALELLAAHEEPEWAAEHHREATRAVEAAEVALARAEEMHQLQLATGKLPGGTEPSPESTPGPEPEPGPAPRPEPEPGPPPR